MQSSRTFVRHLKVLITGRILKSFIYIFIGFFLAGALTFFIGNKDTTKYLNNPNEQIIQSSDYFSVHPQDKKKAAIFDIGLYVDSIYNLDLANLSFNARGWLWYKWDKLPLIDGKMDSKENIGVFDFNLQEESSSSQIKSISNPYFEDGKYWSETSFDAKFAANKINLKNFPFDKQKLQIIVTSNVNETDELVFDPIQFRLPSNAFNILDYKLDGITIEDTVRIYSSNFFDASVVNWQDRISSGGHSQSEASTQSQSIFSVYISRNALTSLIKYVAPLLIVCFLGSLVSFLSPESSATKLSAPPAAILSLIFLQNTYMADIPRTSYLTCMDLLFMLSFLVCFLAFINSLLEHLDQNYSSYKFILERSGILIILISPLAVRGWLALNL